MKCPMCGSTKGFAKVGEYRVQCLACNSLLKKEEIENQQKESNEIYSERDQ